MRTLLNTLQDHDAGHLRILSELWGLNPPPGSTQETARWLAKAMLDPAALQEQVEALPPDASRVLQTILGQGGRLPIAELSRRFGPMRAMGPGRRDREKPWRSPVSPLETVWYRGLIARAFADTPAGPQEFAFIPSEIAQALPRPSPQRIGPVGQKTGPPTQVMPASDSAVDDATTLLAALRRRGAKSIPLPPARMAALSPFLAQPAAAELILSLLHQEGLLAGPSLQPHPETVRPFLDLTRTQALETLQAAWMRSLVWNDLAHVPDLTAPGGRWPNDPVLTRRALTLVLGTIPIDAWWDLDALETEIHETQPAFQRPGGDFDSWYLQDARTGAPLQGFEHWEAVDGAVLRYLIHGPLHWLGVIDLGGVDEDAPATCFRLAPTSLRLLGQPTATIQPDPAALAFVQPDGCISAPIGLPRALRYQIARFCVWEGRDRDGYEYRLSPSSVQFAQTQGLQLAHIRSVLETASGKPLPEGLKRGLERAFAGGAEARLDRPLILRLSDAAVLRELQGNQATRRYLGEALGPAAVLVREQDWERLRVAAARLGLLIEVPGTNPEEAPRGP